MMNETKFTVVISYFEDWDTSVVTYNSLREMLQDLFFDGAEGPDDEWIEDDIKYHDEILEAAKCIRDNCYYVRANAFYVEDGEIKEFDLYSDKLDDELATAYLTLYM